MVQTFSAGDRAKHVEFNNTILRAMEDDNFLPCLIFSDGSAFYICGKVNCHNV